MLLLGTGAEMKHTNHSETNRILGYPSDARLLIINADDFGMCHSTNVAILRSITEGTVRSTTLMAPCPWAAHALHQLRDNTDISFGVHLTAIGDNPDYPWRPLAGRNDVSSLVDESGHFYTFDRMHELFAKVEMKELELEFRTQIETVLAAGLTPTHLDWHALRIAKKREIFDVMFKLSREYGLALRVRDQSPIEWVHRQGLPANDYDFLDSYGLGAVGKMELYLRLLHDLPVGLNEWAVHPGLADAELLAIDPKGAPIRQADLDCMVSAAIRETIEREGITLIDYGALQAVWRGR
jgi:predicted glycoside hydrolase/deacetylase ChbG (UPF0249 family)